MCSSKNKYEFINKQKCKQKNKIFFHAVDYVDYVSAVYDVIVYFLSYVVYLF